MKTTNRLNFRSKGPILIGLVLAAMIGGINAAPSFGDDHGRGGNHDSGRDGHGERGHEGDREHRGRGHDRYVHDRRGYRSNVYEERVYVPPPVIYAPPPPPGIDIFLPHVNIRL